MFSTSMWTTRAHNKNLEPLLEKNTTILFFMTFLPIFGENFSILVAKYWTAKKCFLIFSRAWLLRLAPNLFKTLTIKVRHWTPVECWRDKIPLSLSKARNLLKCLLWQAAFNPRWVSPERTAGGSRTQSRSRKWRFYRGSAAFRTARKRPFPVYVDTWIWIREFEFVQNFHNYQKNQFLRF